MASLTIRNLDDATKARLRLQAALPPPAPAPVRG
ncbi:FitA-like ribbon-helix-helix domain-containing protein [Synechococcus sp. RedBA-s]